MGLMSASFPRHSALPHPYFSGWEERGVIHPLPPSPPVSLARPSRSHRRSREPGAASEATMDMMKAGEHGTQTKG